MKIRSLLAVTICSAWSVVALAEPVSTVPLTGGHLDVEYFVGTGANTSYFVVDFAGNGGNTYAFGYRYDGSKTATDGLLALAGVSNGLYLETQDFGFGLFTTKFAYGSDSDEPIFQPGVDERFWGYFLGDYGSSAVAWNFSSVGIGDRTLANGSFDGFLASDFTLPVVPRLPLAVLGDVNNDAVINQLDLNVVFGNWLSTEATLAQGDANGDGVINQLDINTITANWLATGTSFAGATVPEPNAALLLTLGASIFLRSRRKIGMHNHKG